MSRVPPTPEELFERMVTPFDDDRSQFELMLDRELERTLAMTPAQIRAELEADGYDLAEVERNFRRLLASFGKRKRSRLYSVAPFALIAAALGPVVASVPEILPLAASVETDTTPQVATGAAPPPPTQDGGLDDARVR
jgi:hypothetical protein